MLKQRAKDPAPLAAVAVANGVVPVLVNTSPYDARVKTVAVRSFGAPEIMVGVPSTVVATGVTVDGDPFPSTVTHTSVGFALFTIVAPGMALAAPQRAAPARTYLDACIASTRLKVESDEG